MTSLNNPMPNPQDPNDPMYVFIDTQPASPYPNNPDSSLSHFTNRQFTPEDITNALPVVVTKTAHGLQNEQALRATKFITIPFALATGMEQLNNRLFYIRQVTTDTFQLCDANTNPIDGRSFTPYIQGGQFTLVGEDLPIVNPSHFPPAGVPPVSP
jgi:hypothetical protein